MASKNIKQVLSDAPVFNGMSAEHIERLAAHATEKTVENNVCLFRGGDPVRHFYLLIDGEISIEVPALTGPTLQVQRLKSVRVLGWSWLLPPFKWSFNARAETDSKVLEFDGEAVLKECESDPEFGYEVIKRFSGLMAERLDAAHKKMMEQWSPAGFA
ncbi:MAG: Crp/Fnr family transcriptional regulator [Wenzhouxiangellaceae bacterium]